MHYANRMTDRRLFTRDEVSDIIEDEPMYPGSGDKLDTLDDEMVDDYW